jgi:hypothetical protein
MSIEVPDRYAEALEKGLRDYQETMGLRLTETARIRVGDRDVTPNTLLAYEKHFDGLELILALPGRYPETSALTGYARLMMVTVVFPIKRCLEVHHNTDKESFLRRWPLDKGFSKFGEKKCNGKGSSCCID